MRFLRRLRGYQFRSKSMDSSTEKNEKVMKKRKFVGEIEIDNEGGMVIRDGSIVLVSEEQKYKCVECKKSFRSKNGHLYHHMTKHLRKFECIICFKTYADEKMLMKHKQTVHENISLKKKKVIKKNNNRKEYACSFCGREYECRSACKEHCVTEQLGLRFQCQYCDKSFKASWNCRRHEATHQRPFHCPACDLSFSRKDNFEFHFDYHHADNKKFKCRVCDKPFLRLEGKLKHEEKCSQTVHEKTVPSKSQVKLKSSPVKKRKNIFNDEYVFEDPLIPYDPCFTVTLQKY